jgi:hypothetical protein
MPLGCQPVDAAVGETSKVLRQIQLSLDNLIIKNLIYNVFSTLEPKFVEIFTSQGNLNLTRKVQQIVCLNARLRNSKM